MKPGGVKKTQSHVACHGGMLKDVTGGAGDVGDDGEILADQEIVKRTLADVGLSDDGGGHAVRDGASRFVGRQQGVYLFFDFFEFLESFFIGEVAEVLVGIIDARENGTHHADEFFPYACECRRQTVARLRRCQANLREPLCLEKFSDALGIRQGQFPVRKGTARELAAACRLGSGAEERFKDGPRQNHAAVASQLDGIFAGIGMRRGKANRHAVVDNFVFIEDVAVYLHPYRGF